MNKRVSNKTGRQRVAPARSRKLKASAFGVKIAIKQMQAEAKREARKRQLDVERAKLAPRPTLFQRAAKAVGRIFGRRS